MRYKLTIETGIICNRDLVVVVPLANLRKDVLKNVDNGVHCGITFTQKCDSN